MTGINRNKDTIGLIAALLARIFARLAGKSTSFVSISGGQPIQVGAESFGFSCATFILRSSNSQKPFPRKKYVLPITKSNFHYSKF